jgi:hypothetical protein
MHEIVEVKDEDGTKAEGWGVTPNSAPHSDACLKRKVFENT